MIKVSVVVPVYNAAQYLEQCLDSILNQTLSEIEIICVDDGSTDDSLLMLERYAEKDGRVSVLHQRNKYAGAARNAGIDRSTGRYLVFWDADDYFSPNALELMYQQCERDEADVCVCEASRFYESMGKEVQVSAYIVSDRLPDSIPFSAKTNGDFILNFTNEAPWNKMFRREFIHNSGLRFQAIRNGNDVFFVACALCLADRITVVRKPLVCYRTAKAVGSTTGSDYNPVVPLTAWVDVRKELQKRDAFPEDSYIRKTAVVVLHLLQNVSRWETYRDTVDYLKRQGLDELLLANLRHEDFYLQSWHRDYLERLMSDSPEQFLVFSAHEAALRYKNLMGTRALLINQRKELRRQNKRLTQENEKMKKQLEQSHLEKNEIHNDTGSSDAKSIIGKLRRSVLK